MTPLQPEWWAEQIKQLGFPIVICSLFMFGAWQLGGQVIEAHTMFLREHVTQMQAQTKVLENHATILDTLRSDSEGNGKTLEAILEEQRHTTEAVRAVTQKDGM